VTLRNGRFGIGEEQLGAVLDAWVRHTPARLPAGSRRIEQASAIGMSEAVAEAHETRSLFDGSTMARRAPSAGWRRRRRSGRRRRAEPGEDIAGVDRAGSRRSRPRRAIFDDHFLHVIGLVGGLPWRPVVEADGVEAVGQRDQPVAVRAHRQRVGQAGRKSKKRRHRSSASTSFRTACRQRRISGVDGGAAEFFTRHRSRW